MSDLIDRQAAIDAIERELSLVERPITETRWFDLGLRKSQEVLRALTSVQPEPKTGRWIPQNWNETSGTCTTLVYCLPKCSVCGYSAIQTNYCPNCGARMGGDAE